MHKPTTVQIPLANVILERIPSVFTDMLGTANLDIQDTVNAEMSDGLLVAAAWAVCSTYHKVLKLLPETTVFSRDISMTDLNINVE